MAIYAGSVALMDNIFPPRMLRSPSACLDWPTAWSKAREQEELPYDDAHAAEVHDAAVWVVALAEPL